MHSFSLTRQPLCYISPYGPQNLPYFCGPLSLEPDASSSPTKTLPYKDSNNNANPASDPALFTFGETGSRHLANLASKPALLAFIKTGSQHLANWPVAFGYSVQPHSSTRRCLYNSELTHAAKSIAHFDLAIYGFNRGHFISSIRSLGLPVNITLSADSFVNGRSLFTEFNITPSPILSGVSALLHHVQSSGITSILLGYLIHSHRYLMTKPTSCFWEIQALIITQLRLT